MIGLPVCTAADVHSIVGGPIPVRTSPAVAVQGRTGRQGYVERTLRAKPNATKLESWMAKKTKKKSALRRYTKDDVRMLKAHSKARTPVARVSRLMKRTEGALRQKAKMLGIGLGHQR